MLPRTHIILGFIFSGLLFLIFPLTLFQASLIFLSSFLIDFDHYLYYLFKKRDFSLKRAYFWFKMKGKKLKELPREERKKYSTAILCFHGLEILIILFILGYLISNLFYFVLIGAGFHLILDYIYLIKNPHNPMRVSLIHDFLKFKKLKKI